VGIPYNDEYYLEVGACKSWSKSIKAKQALFLFDGCTLGAEFTPTTSITAMGDPKKDMMTDTIKLKSREAFAATLGGEEAYSDDEHTFFRKRIP
jgi:hypothetical protein